MQSNANINPMTIKPKTGKSKLEKCPECYRKTMRDGKCERCRHEEKGGRRFVCL